MQNAIESSPLSSSPPNSIERPLKESNGGQILAGNTSNTCINNINSNASSQQSVNSSNNSSNGAILDEPLSPESSSPSTLSSPSFSEKTTQLPSNRSGSPSQPKENGEPCGNINNNAASLGEPSSDSDLGLVQAPVPIPGNLVSVPPEIAGPPSEVLPPQVFQSDPTKSAFIIPNKELPPTTALSPSDYAPPRSSNGGSGMDYPPAGGHPFRNGIPGSPQWDDAQLANSIHPAQQQRRPPVHHYPGGARTHYPPPPQHQYLVNSNQHGSGRYGWSSPNNGGSNGGGSGIPGGNWSGMGGHHLSRGSGRMIHGNSSSPSSSLAQPFPSSPLGPPPSGFNGPGLANNNSNKMRKSHAFGGKPMMEMMGGGDDVHHHVQGGPLDTMRNLEQYLPDGSHRGGNGGGGMSNCGKGKPPPMSLRGGGGGEDYVGGGGGGGPSGEVEHGYDANSSGFFSSTRSSPRSQTSQYDATNERFSRKVFVGGLPPDIDEDEITASFRRFGPLVVDWPHKAESKSYFPPKGYAFLLFQDETSVQSLIDACIQDEDKLYLCVSSPTIKDKPVQIRPWRLSDADFVLDASLPLDPRKTVFVGGVPRPLKAVELALIMDRLYGGVCYAGIDTDPELKYPKGAGRVAFSNQQSYIAAISARFVQLQHGEIDKRVEVKPYVLDDQLCDECQGTRCGGKFAPFFCANVTCLQYYCEQCWATIHSRPGREFHKPLVKEGADRPRTVPYRWC
eukprot:TRINITY_DN1683_c0_g1_i1.p1 TRINITY_DN1683_c0_g1~~TRINITY_DN1683_c0_g1_i1.p1  ORF type:complete len:731 (-),score=197.28 TRINITY_DN1683_c0_g1_i1:1795-3987(-)